MSRTSNDAARAALVNSYSTRLAGKFCATVWTPKLDMAGQHGMGESAGVQTLPIAPADWNSIIAFLKKEHSCM